MRAELHSLDSRRHRAVAGEDNRSNTGQSLHEVLEDLKPALTTEEVLDELLRGLTPANRDLAVQIAAIPEYIRGFDTVKDAQLVTAKEKEAELLATFRGQAVTPLRSV